MTIADIVNAKQGDINNYSDATVAFHAKNIYLYISDTRKVLSETVQIDYFKKTLIAQLKHQEGVADLRFKNGIFHIEGNNFGDTFMQNLFSLSKFQNGKLNFKMRGKPSEYNGLFNINNTTLLDYKIFNNILAFINTVPSLVTLSVPNYSKSGLFVKNAYLNFKAKDDLFHISDIYLDSKELDIAGKGEASFVKDSIDLKLNLKTDLGSSASKIPLVGYIVFDKDSVATTLDISGSLSDPKVETLIAQDIAVAPLGILLRTLSLPKYLLESLEDNTTSK